MDIVCNSEDCPRFYICKSADTLQWRAFVADYRNDGSCTEENGYPKFERNSVSLKGLNEHLIICTDIYMKRINRIKAAMDILLKEEEGKP